MSGNRTAFLKSREAVTAVVFLAAAVWLLFPFIRLDRSVAAGSALGVYRLAGGLMILIIYLGKWLFDVLSPQGAGHRVSTVKAVLLIALCVVILAFVVFIVIQAASLYIQSSVTIQDDASGQTGF